MADTDQALDKLMEERLAEAVSFLRLLANERRLLILCTLVAEGEASVSHLAGRIGQSHPAMSQHLAKLRHDGFVATRRSRTVIYYRIADQRIAALIATMKDLFCADIAATATGAVTA